ncbi:MAG: hypothetical protein JO112_07210 [Planctomycetes bacterium]|nr:hypothetical protein [Planctomycetota bacterium]
MKAEIKSISCSGRPDFKAWQPDRSEDVYLGLELSVGLAGGEGADLFQLVVATPQAIQGRPERRRCKLLVIEAYSWQKVETTLRQWVGECERATWMEIVDCLQHRFDWEYEGMPGR